MKAPRPLGPAAHLGLLHDAAHPGGGANSKESSRARRGVETSSGIGKAAGELGTAPTTRPTEMARPRSISRKASPNSTTL
jgi:hypothetical protein